MFFRNHHQDFSLFTSDSRSVNVKFSCSVQGHVFRLVLLAIVLGLFLERLHEGLHVARSGRSHGLVAEVELADERRQLRRLEGRRKEAERLLELRRGHRAADLLPDVGRALVLGREQLLHPLDKVGVGQQGAHRLRRQARGQVDGRAGRRLRLGAAGRPQAGQDVLQVRELDVGPAAAGRRRGRGGGRLSGGGRSGRRGRAAGGRGRRRRCRPRGGGGRRGGRGGAGSGGGRGPRVGPLPAGLPEQGGQLAHSPAATAAPAEGAAEEVHELLLVHVVEQRLELGVSQVAEVEQPAA